MAEAVIYTRVSSREQQQEGFSLTAQSKLLREYAQQRGLCIVQSFEDVETAKRTGRKQFSRMVDFFKRSRSCRVLLVEKTDRISRNFHDAVTLEDLDIEIHFVKEGQVISKDAKAQATLLYGFNLVLARHYSNNLREEVKKGMREKAAQGVFPGYAPFGYRNNRAERTIEVDTEDSPIVQRIFALYGTGSYSLSDLAKVIRLETGQSIGRSKLHWILRNHFYAGSFEWGGNTYQGAHPLFIDPPTFDQVQQILAGRNRSEYSKRQIAFRRLMRCAYDGRVITGEIQKERYVYYHCTESACRLPRFREEEITERLGEALRRLQGPAGFAANIASILHSEWGGVEILKARLAALRSRMDRAYTDKLDGKIPEDFWRRNMNTWLVEKEKLKAAIQEAERVGARDVAAEAQKAFGLANSAYALYCSHSDPHEKAKVLKTFLADCLLDAESVTPTYRPPFDLIEKKATSEEWSQYFVSEVSDYGRHPIYAAVHTGQDADSE